MHVAISTQHGPHVSYNLGTNTVGSATIRVVGGIKNNVKITILGLNK